MALKWNPSAINKGSSEKKKTTKKKSTKKTTKKVLSKQESDPKPTKRVEKEECPYCFKNRAKSHQKNCPDNPKNIEIFNKVDNSELEALKKQFEEFKKTIDLQIRALSLPSVKDKNLVSPAQLETILYDKYQIPNGINYDGMKRLVKTNKIPANEAYFLVRMIRDKKSLNTFHLLLDKYDIEDYKKIK